MGLFQANFNKPGKGVDENAPQKRSFFRFWEVFGRKSGKLMKLNLVYFLFLIPTLLLYLLLTGLITSPILSMDSVRGFIGWIAEQYVDSTQTSAAEFAETLLITFDGFLRVALTFLVASFWGMGPATAGATYIWRNFAREEHAWIWSDFKDAVKVNFIQSVAVFLIDTVVFVLFCTAIRVYGSMPGVGGILQYVICLVALIYTLMHFYLYPMMVTFELSLKDLYKNALIFSLGKLPSNLFVLVILILVHIVPAYVIALFLGQQFITYLVVLALLEAVILLSFSGFLVNFNAYPKMKKYMLKEDSDIE